MSASKPIATPTPELKHTTKPKKAKTVKTRNHSVTPAPATDPEAQPATQPHTTITQRNINHSVTAGPIATQANRIALEKRLDALQSNPTATTTQIRKARQQLRDLRNNHNQ